MAFTALLFVMPGAIGQGDDPGVWRDLPEIGACGAEIQVSLYVEVPEGTESWLVEEKLPEGVSASNVESAYNGEYESENNRITWVSTNGASTALTYNLTISEDLEQDAVLEFSGEYRFHPHMDERAATIGNQAFSIECIEAAPEADPASMTRTLPATAKCGETVTVTVVVETTETIMGWALEETPHETADVLDWTRTYDGDYKDETHSLKWFSLPANATVLTYEFKIPKDTEAGTVLEFTGEQIFIPAHQDGTEVLGDDKLTVQCTKLNPMVVGGGLGGVAAVALGAGLLVYRRKTRA